MWSWLNKNAKSVQAVGTVLGGLGTTYSAYAQQKSMNEANKLNASLLKRQINKEDRAQRALEDGFNLSLFGKKDETQLKL